MEKIPKNEQQINNQDNSRVFENIHEELLDYQFQYIDKLETKKIKELEDKEIEKLNDSEKFKKSFEDNLDTLFEKNLFKYTDFSNDLRDEYKKRVKNNYDYDDNFKEFLKNVFIQIDNEHLKNKNWKDSVKNITTENLNKIGPVIYNKNSEEIRPGKEKLGLIDFNLLETDEFKNFGIDEMDTCLEIHFEDLFSQKQKNNEINNIFSKESLSQLAIDIVEEYTETKFIVGRSWLIGSPIGRRIGFDTFYNDKVAYNSGRFWGQFINENGQIKKEKIQKFLDTGVPEFLPSVGFIKVEDFLKKYLPKEKRGVVTLKEFTEESKKFKKDYYLIRKEVNENLFNLSNEEILSFLNKNEELADYFNTQNGKDYLSLLEKMKDLILKKEDVNSLKNSENSIRIVEKFNNFLISHSNRFIEKKVLID